MKKRSLLAIVGTIVVGAFLAAGATVWAAKGNQGGKPPPSPDPVPDTPIDGYYFWRLGHMDGPHDMSQALGISRDGKVAVGSTAVVDFWKAFRIDIDWAISTGDGVAPLYNELQVQENIGLGAAYAASDMLDENGNPIVDCPYSKVDPETTGSVDNFDWCGSLPAGTLTKGTVSYAAEWLFAFDPEATEEDPVNYLGIPDFGGGVSDMAANDVSADGTIIVGTGNVKTGPVAFLADMTTSTVDPETGETVVEPVQLIITEATEENPEGQTLQTSSAEAVSVIVEEEGDGIYIAGRSDSPKGPQACIWFEGDDPATEEIETWVVKGIGGLSKKKYDSVATGIVYRPGSTAGDLMVVGTSKSILYPSEAFVWTGNPVLEPDGPYALPDGGENEYIGYMYDLEKILIKTGAAESSGMGSAWVLNEGTGVALSDVVNAGDAGPSARIVGWGTNPEGGGEAWLVTNFPYDDLAFIKE